MVNKKHVLEKIESNKEELKKKGVTKIGLFGSILRNRENKKSDVDILIEFKEISFNNYADVLLLLEKLLKRDIDLIIEQNLRPELAYVKKEAEYASI